MKSSRVKGKGRKGGAGHYGPMLGGDMKQPGNKPLKSRLNILPLKAAK